MTRAAIRRAMSHTARGLHVASRAGIVMVRAVWRLVPEMLNATTILGGWALLTWGIADLVGVWQVWPLSGGLLLLSLAGWGHLRVLFGAGLYTLTRNDRG